MTTTTVTKRTIAPWFMSNSFGADYGTYTCGQCSTTFYHSPSTVYRGDEVIHDCVCGHCANRVLNQDHGSNYYE